MSAAKKSPKIPGTYRYLPIEDDLPRFQLTGKRPTGDVAFVREIPLGPAIPLDRPLMSSAEWGYTYSVEGEAEGRTTIFEWLPPKKSQGKHHVQLKVDRSTTYALVLATPTGGETAPRAMFEECAGFMLADVPEQLVVDLLMMDHRARCGDKEILGGVVAAELGLFFQRVATAAAKGGA